MKLNFVVVYERAPNNYGAYVPELPGCIATGDELAGDSDDDTRGDRLPH